jgi:hypothetical protein
MNSKRTMILLNHGYDDRGNVKVVRSVIDCDINDPKLAEKLLHIEEIERKDYNNDGLYTWIDGKTGKTFYLDKSVKINYNRA